MNRFVIILSHNRQELLNQVIAAIGPQVEMVIVIDNASDPPIQVEAGQDWRTVVIPIPDQPPNLARFWNVGIKVALEMATPGEQPYIAFLCDDAVVPAGWFAAVTEAMANTGAVVGCGVGDMPLGHARVKTSVDGAIMERMTGHAWILDPVSPVRPDESMLLWWCDTDIDWQARTAGGMVSVGGYPVPNIHPSGFMLTHPELIHQTGVDSETFAAKHGWRPW